ncbi:MAG: M43 family zinc metalloprotease [Planctomycetota bacterium]|jgi:hypothetical protein
MRPHLLIAAIVILATARLAAAADGCASVLNAADVDIVRDLAATGVYELPLGAGAGDEIVVPIAVHVVRRTTGTEGLTIAQVMATLDDLDAAFVEANMSFCLVADIDFIDDDDLYLEINSIGEINELRQTNVVSGAINIYFTEELSAGVALCGISSFTFSGVQGIVVRNSCTAAGGNASTTAHEVGHYLDLFHTHETALGVECPDGSNCQTAGDLLCDTPADPGLGLHNVTLGCIYVGNDPIPCIGSPDEYDPDTHNIMSFSRDECQDQFTGQQNDRMRATLQHLRPELEEFHCLDLDFEPPNDIFLLSRDIEGFVGDNFSSRTALNKDGRLVVFASRATRLVPGDTTHWWDLFLHDRQTATTERITVNFAGEEGFGNSRRPSITADGRFVTFASTATNLISPGAFVTQGWQVVLLDRDTGLFQRVSNDMNGGPVNSHCDVTATTPDGRFIAYVTAASDIVPDDTNGFFGRDVFVHDRQTSETERVNVSTTGEQADGTTTWSWDTIGISDDGRFVTFTSYAPNLVEGDTNEQPDIFLHDRTEGKTVRISVGPDGEQANDGSAYPHISADGRHIAFTSRASNLVPNDENGNITDVFLFDRETGEMTIIARTDDGDQPDGAMFDLSMSPDMRFATFISTATNYDPDQTPGQFDAYVHDRESERTVLVSPRGIASDSGGVHNPAVSGDGSTAAFASVARDLVPHDINGLSDAFVAPVDTRRLGDVNGNGVVDFADILAVIGLWGPCPPPPATCPADLDGDGTVGFGDVLIVLANFSPGPPSGQ